MISTPKQRLLNEDKSGVKTQKKNKEQKFYRG